MLTVSATTTMRNTRRAGSLGLILLGSLLGAGTPAQATPIPNKFLLSGYFGSGVDKTTGGDVCTLASKDECQQGAESSEPGGFFDPAGVAVDNDPSSPSYEHVYVADKNNHRVDELTPAGEFVSMFGQEVNSQGGSTCTAAEAADCQAGSAGGAPGQFGEFVPSVAVDPATGDVYVADAAPGEVGGEFAVGRRVQVFSSSGVFLRAIGRDVNKNNGANFCAGSECQPAALQTEEQASGETEAGAFDFELRAGNILAIGGPSDTLYVGDRGRVQEFSSTTGASEGEVSLSALSSTGLAVGVGVDQAGDLFVADSEASGVDGVHEYNAAGNLEPVVIDPNSSQIKGLAVDPHGRVGVINADNGLHAVLYTPAGREVSEFSPAFGAATITPQFPGFPNAVAFSSSGDAFIANEQRQYVEAYTSVVFPEVSTCAVSEVTGTSAKLCAEIDPQSVHARGFFAYGKTPSLGALTPTAFEGESEALETVGDTVTGLVPHQQYSYRAAVEAQANGEPLQAHGETIGFETKVVPPQVLGAPVAKFASSQSAVVSATLDPEHTTTRYHFEYGPCPSLAGCAGVASSPDESSSVFGQIGTTVELTGLAPSTTYAYRLVATNEYEEGGQTHQERTVGAQATFTTAPVPVPAAETGGYTALSSTGALIAANVSPNGVPTSYAFEVGVYEGAATQYGIVFSGSAGAGVEAVPVSYQLTGLQPGTAYAYRLTISSGFIQSPSHTLQGASVVFTTPGLPAAIAAPASLPLLGTPAIAFPATVEPKPVTRRARTTAQKLAHALKACKHRPTNQRAACRRAARRKYHPRRA